MECSLRHVEQRTALTNPSYCRMQPLYKKYINSTLTIEYPPRITLFYNNLTVSSTTPGTRYITWFSHVHLNFYKNFPKFFNSVV